MNIEDGTVYPSLEEAMREAGSPQDVVEVFGTTEQVQRLSSKVQGMVSTCLSDDAFRDLLDLVMASDPTPVGEALRNFIDLETRKRGYENWIDAYHKHMNEPDITRRT